MVEINERVPFLNKLHIFSGLDSGQLTEIAAKLVVMQFPKGKKIIKRGDKPDGFYLIYKGKVRVSAPEKGAERQLALLYNNDYFGEEALFERKRRSATVTADEDCTLLYLSRERFATLISQHEKLKPNFQVAIRSRRLARSTHFKWLGKNEVIHFIARRHVLLLYRALIAPVVALILPISFFFFGFSLQSVTLIALAWTFLFLDFGWVVWQWVDWGNDYFIVTNQRVVWLEKVVFLYDSREEAPLGSLLSVGVETDMLGRIFHFGNVIVRTFVGRLEFDHVDHPVQAADMIREYWERTKTGATRSQMDLMTDAIKQKLGLPLDKPPKQELAPVTPVDEEKISNTPLWLLALQSVFQLRLEDGGKVIYRKHLYILVVHAWKPLLTFLGALGLLLWRISYIARSEEVSFFHVNQSGWNVPDAISSIIFFAFLPIAFWLWYEYEDWRNDIFMVSQDEIFDIDKKPFAQEERRSAQIENILSTSYSRDGIAANLFNFGTVKITVGGTQLAFENVMDPAAVQADINRRRSARIAKKNENAGSEDRERFATWIAAYHEHLNEFNKNFAPPAEDVDTTRPTPTGANVAHQGNLPILDDTHSLNDNFGGSDLYDHDIYGDEGYGRHHGG
ncbi:MAG: cyclic nucleotide-binding domain-containing protein [Anaerolineales bacterium]|nr:cyclic nucleotide-binding domain-containing protein [Anaerolineales bacterium]